MDWNRYYNLTLEDRKALWQALASQPAYQLLRDRFLKAGSSLPKVTNQNDKEHFFYEAVRQTAIVELLDFPFDEMESLDLAKNMAR